MHRKLTQPSPREIIPREVIPQEVILQDVILQEVIPCKVGNSDSPVFMPVTADGPQQPIKNDMYEGIMWRKF